MALAENELEPLILADGTKVDPSTGKVIKEKKQRFVEIPSASKAVAIVARTKRSIAELPVPPSKMNGLSLVLFYTLYGLADQDIAIALNISRQQVENIKKLEEYQNIFNDVQRTILEHEANDVRNIFQQHAANAARKVVDIAENADDDSVLGFKAAQDILDRAGHRPVDTVMHKHQMDDSLKIVYIKKDEGTAIPDIVDAEFEEVKDGNGS
jgi:hypothetical protein